MSLVETLKPCAPQFNRYLIPSIEIMAEGLDYAREYREITLPKILKALRNFCISGGLWFGATALTANIQKFKELHFYFSLILMLPVIYWIIRLLIIECPKCGYHIIKHGWFWPKHCLNCKAKFK